MRAHQATALHCTATYQPRCTFVRLNGVFRMLVQHTLREQTPDSQLSSKAPVGRVPPCQSALRPCTDGGHRIVSTRTLYPLAAHAVQFPKPPTCHAMSIPFRSLGLVAATLVHTQQQGGFRPRACTVAAVRFRRASDSQARQRRIKREELGTYK